MDVNFPTTLHLPAIQTIDLTVPVAAIRPTTDRQIVGWKEWVRLPGLGMRNRMKAKVDTGAATSALHAEELELFERNGMTYCRFLVLPRQRSRTGATLVERPLVDIRKVRSSNGTTEERPVIATDLWLGGQTWPIELTLTSRDLMGFRMLLGRSALENRAIVDVSQAHVLGS